MADKDFNDWFTVSLTALRTPFQRNVAFVWQGSYVAYTYTANAVNQITVAVNLYRVPTTVSTTPGDYTITGASSMTVTAVSRTPGSTVILLTVSGTFVQSGAYVLAILSGAVKDSNGSPTEGTASFTGPVIISSGGANFNTGYN